MFAVREPTSGEMFPARTMVILSLCATLNSYTLVNLFPYVGLMAKELLGLETTNELGYYAGYVASSFTFGRFVSGYGWGHITDSVGRKPVIVGGLLSIMVCSLAFGLSPTFGFAIASRLALGLTNGMAPALRIATREVCGQEHVLQGMTYLAGAKAVSLVFGTGIGGLLAQPAVNYPSLFSGNGLFGRYPFLLPNLVGAVAALVLLLVVVLFIPETKHFDARRAENFSIRGAPTYEPRVLKQTPDDDATSAPSTNSTGRDSPSYHRALTDDNTDGGGELTRQPTPHKSLTGDNYKRRGGLARNPTSHQSLPNDTYDGEGGIMHHPTSHQSFPDDGVEGTELTRLPMASPSLETQDSHGANSSSNYGTGALNGEGDWDGHVTDERDGRVCGPHGLLSVPHVKMVLFLVCVVQGLLIGFEEAYPLWALSTPDVGGLGWDNVEIGKVFLAAGVIVAVLQLVVFPRLIKVLGITVWQRIGCLLAVPAFIVVPYSKSLSWNGGSLFFVSVASTSLVYCCMAMVNLALATSSTTLVCSAMRGKLSGMFNMAENLGRFSGPVGFATMFALSISPSSSHWMMGHQFVFLFAGVSMAVVAVLAWGGFTRENMTHQKQNVSKKDAAYSGISGGGVGGGGGYSRARRNDSMDVADRVGVDYSPRGIPDLPGSAVDTTVTEV